MVPIIRRETTTEEKAQNRLLISAALQLWSWTVCKYGYNRGPELQSSTQVCVVCRIYYRFTDNYVMQGSSSLDINRMYTLKATVTFHISHRRSNIQSEEFVLSLRTANTRCLKELGWPKHLQHLAHPGVSDAWSTAGCCGSFLRSLITTRHSGDKRKE